MPRRRLLPLVALGIVIAILVGQMAFAAWRSRGESRRFFDLLRAADGVWETSPPSASLRRFFDRCAEVRPDRSVYDIDGLFENFPGGWTDDPEFLASPAGPVKRPPTQVKWFHSIPDAGESTYSIHIYFDDSHRVVGKWVGAAD